MLPNLIPITSKKGVRITFLHLYSRFTFIFKSHIGTTLTQSAHFVPHSLWGLPKVLVKIGRAKNDLALGKRPGEQSGCTGRGVQFFSTKPHSLSDFSCCPQCSPIRLVSHCSLALTTLRKDESRCSNFDLEPVSVEGKLKDLVQYTRNLIFFFQQVKGRKF